MTSAEGAKAWESQEKNLGRRGDAQSKKAGDRSQIKSTDASRFGTEKKRRGVGDQSKRKRVVCFGIGSSPRIQKSTRTRRTKNAQFL